MKTLLLLICASIALSINTYAQKTGSFDENITFNGEQRTVSFYVPLNYSPDSTYKLMVGLHGAGDNSSNYRAAIHSTLKWETVIPNTIFVYPDGGSDQSRDFYAPAGDEQIINEAISKAKSLYSNIDNNEIILQGFSLGGRSALIFGLDNPDTFKGLVLNTPAIQGIYDLENKLGLDYSINYKNSSKIPIAIVHGEDDFAYLEINQKLEKKIIKENGIVYRVQITNMPHTIPPSQIEVNFFNFINNPYRDGVDIQMVELDMPQRTCDNTLTTNLLIRNFGGITSGKINVKVIINGKVKEFTPDITLDPYKALTISLNDDDLALLSGKNNIEVIAEPSTGTDLNVNNNSISGEIYMYDESISESLIMGFEGNEKHYEDWFNESEGNLLTWSVDSDVSKSGNNSMSTFNTVLLFTSQGLSEDLLSPYFDLTQLENKSVIFDYAFNYHKYTPPYFTQDVIFTDTLRVFISNDCGDTYDLLFEKSGAELATADEPIVNPLDITSAIFVPNNDEWGTINIDLSDYSFQSNSTLKFSLVSGQGGTIYLDNIRIGDASSSVESVKEKTVSIAPNPARNEITINDTKPTAETKYTLTSLNGTVIDSFNIEGLKSINVNSLNSGVYFITKTIGNTKETHKFIKE
ncbi:MAG: T9SS type A sorting domain-containing protein [Candidatus Kapaibacterium sp.]